MDTVILTLVAMGALSVEESRLSYYWPGDGHNGGELACGGRFTWQQVHVAHRRWWKLGCRTPVVVCSRQTGRCAAARVMDGGPYGIVNRKGRWKRWAKLTEKRPRRLLPPPPGWRWRGGMDLSYALWKRLGEPRFLSQAQLFVVSEELWRLVRAVNEAFGRIPAAPATSRAPGWRGRDLSRPGDVLEAGPHAVEDVSLRDDHPQVADAVLAHAKRLGELGIVEIESSGLPHEVARGPGAGPRLVVRHRETSHAGSVVHLIGSATLQTPDNFAPAGASG